MKNRLHCHRARGCLCFLVFESRATKQDPRHQHQQQTRRHTAGMSEHPGRPQKKAFSLSRLVNPAAAATEGPPLSIGCSSWCQEHAERDEDTSGSLLHVSASRALIVENAESLFRPTGGWVLRRPWPLLSIDQNVGPPFGNV